MDGVHHTWVILVLVGLFAYLVSHCFISVYEVIQMRLIQIDLVSMKLFVFPDDN